MIPIALDPTRLRLGLAGRGPLLRRRLDLLGRGGATPALFSNDAEAVAGWPLASPLEAVATATLDVLWIAGLPDGEAAALARAARSRGALVNVEDVRTQCDFHSVAEVRRGDLLLTVSTGGRSPALTARLRADLARRFGPEWEERLHMLAQHRDAWRRQGMDLSTLARRSDAVIDAAGWLS
ncbi:MAG: siroheme synthase [Rhodospirillales bacterium]|nr:siroheme synthase [Rhodospirillales bacterium]